MRLADLRCVVTGGASGIGAATVRRFAAEGAQVCILDRDLVAAEALAGELGGDHFALELDVRFEAAVEQAAQQVYARWEAVDVLVNNAGTCFMSDFPDIPPDEFRRQMAVNFESCFHCCQAVIPLMQGRDGVRKIVNISSNGAYNFDVFDPPHYRASKAAMDTLTKDLARRYATEKIAVNSIAPAMTETPLFNVLTEETLAKAISAMPHGSAMKPEQIAAWVSFLAGPGGDVCSGNVIILNQGRDVR